ncbi:hypothetical protein [Tangfeifania diversioriginum]|nr:hypothetical protein [Tangfeifania diversioriginum]
MDWKEGETKQISIQLSGQEIKNGKSVKDTTLTTESKIIISSVTDSSYFIKLKTENQLINLGSSYYNDLLNEFSGNQSFEIDIKIKKDSLTSEIINSKEYKANLNKSRAEILNILKNKTPEKLHEATVQLNELSSSLESKSEALQIIDLLLYSYKIHYSFTDTLYTMDAMANPFKLQHFNGAEVKTYVIKSADSTNYNIVEEKSFDFKAYKDLLAGASNQVSGTIDKMVADTSTTQITDQMNRMFSALLNSMDFGASEKLTVTRKLDSSWPVKLLRKTEFKISAPTNKSAGFVEELMVIK